MDFVLSQWEAVTAVEVKSGRAKSFKGPTAFVNRVPHARAFVVGAPPCSLEGFVRGTCRCSKAGDGSHSVLLDNLFGFCRSFFARDIMNSRLSA